MIIVLAAAAPAVGAVVVSLGLHSTIFTTIAFGDTVTVSRDKGQICFVLPSLVATIFSNYAVTLLLVQLLLLL